VVRAQKGLVHRLYVNIAGAGGGDASSLAASPVVSVASARQASTVQSGTAYSAGGGVFYFDLTSAASTANVDDLTVTWTYTHESSAQTIIDEVAIVGQRLAPLILLNDSLGRGGSSDDYLHRRKELALQAAEQAFEEECGRYFTTHYRKVTLDGENGCWMTLPDYPVQSLVSCTVDESSVTVGDLTLYKDTGRVYSEDGVFTRDVQNVVFGYEHGEKSVPADVQRAVSLIASATLADGPWDDRGFGVSTDGGFVRLLTAGVGSAAFSIPEVQAAVNRYRRHDSEAILGR
jgi:hypothetical protein